MKTLLLILVLASPVSAQGLPSPTARKVADIASYGTALTPVVLDTIHSWQCENRARCLTLEGVRLGVGYGATTLLKHLVHEDRPCSPSCGVDAPTTSFPSAHTMLPFTALGGPRLSVVLPFGVATGGLRVAAGKHWWWDTVAGAGIGLATSYIR